MVLKLFLALTLGLMAHNSSAQIFKININDYGFDETDPTNAALKSLIDTEIAKVQTEVNEGLPSAPPDRLMEGMANSSVMAGKGIGTDYASNMDVFLIGAGIGVGADLEKDPDTDSDISGAGVAPGVIIGMNLGWMDTARFLGMDTNRLNVYANFMGYSTEYKLEDEPTKKSSIELGMTSLGLHFRYDWIKGNGNKLLGWGGVKFNFGYEYNKTNLTFNSTINETVDATSGGSTINGTITGNPKATIESSTHSIPIAFSTDIQLLYFVSVYTGLGADLNFGSAKGSGSLNAPESDIVCTSGAECTAAGNPTIKVQPTANIDGSGSVTPLLFRGFAGVQFNLPFIRIFAQVDKAFGNELIGATAGVRLVY